VCISNVASTTCTPTSGRAGAAKSLMFTSSEFYYMYLHFLLSTAVQCISASLQCLWAYLPNRVAFACSFVDLTA